MIHLTPAAASGIGRALLGVGGASRPRDAGAGGRPDGAARRPQRLPGSRARTGSSARPGRCSAARAVLFDEADDPRPAPRRCRPTLAAALDDELYGKHGWRAPFDDEEPLRIYVARRESGGVRAVAAAGAAKGTARARRDPARRVRPVDRADRARGRRARSSARRSTATALRGRVPDPGDRRGARPWIAAGARRRGRLDRWRPRRRSTSARGPSVLGRLWVDEVARAAGGTGFLREVWERAAGAAASRRCPMRSRACSPRASGETARPRSLLRRRGAAVHAAVEPEAAPSRLRLLDLESGALDAARARGASRCATARSCPRTDETLRVRVAAGRRPRAPRSCGIATPRLAARRRLLRRRATCAPIPLSGVARVDWVVAGSAGGRPRRRARRRLRRRSVGRSLHAGSRRAPSRDPSGAAPDLDDGEPRGPVGLGDLPRGGPGRRAHRAHRSRDRAFLGERRRSRSDTSSWTRPRRPGAFYRYTVWAVTSEGLLARAFAATLKAE